MRVKITEQAEVTASYLEYMTAVMAAMEGIDTAGLDVHCSRFGEVWVFSNEYCGAYSWSGEGTPAEALEIALGRYRSDLKRWNERGKRSRDLGRAGEALARTCLGTPVDVRTKYDEYVDGAGSTKRKLVSGFSVIARELDNEQVRFFGAAALSRYQTVSANMEPRRSRLSVDFDDPGDAETFVEFLLSFCDKIACECCNGTGYCLSCDGEGCSECAGSPECGECQSGTIMVWGEG